MESDLDQFIMVEAMSDEMEMMADEIMQLRAELSKERELRKKGDYKLFLAQQEIWEKDELIKECEDYIIKLEMTLEDHEIEISTIPDMQEKLSVEIEAGDVRDGDGVGDSGIKFGDGIVGGGWMLPMIPEEDPDLIPDYYDVCVEYAESLKFFIGSDFDQTEPQDEIQEPEIEVDVVVEEPAEEAVPVEGEDPNLSDVNDEPVMNETGDGPVNEQGEILKGETLNKALNKRDERRKLRDLSLREEDGKRVL